MENSQEWSARAAEKLVRYEALFDVLAALSSTENVETIVEHAAKRWKYFSNVACWRLVLDHADGWLLVDCIRGKATINYLSSLPDWDAHHWMLQRPMVIESGQLVDEPPPPPHMILPGIIEVSLLPVFREMQCIGLFTLGTHHAPFGELDKKFNRMFCAHFADRVVGLIERREAERQLYERATTDALTKLLNRGTIIDHLSRQLALARRCGQPLSVIMADIDHFKAINDKYGHITGDEVLRVVARRLSDVARDGDSIGRYGGEEFLFVLYPCTAEEVRHAAERFLQAVNRAPIEVPGVSARTISVTISMGAMTCDQHADVALDTLLGRADMALYRAKQEGRDRFAIVA